MQDRFKFRAWCEKNKIYHYEDFVVTATGFIAKIASGGEICQTDMEYDESLILEQCTGLRDKNGKLIYEGDIIKGIHPDDDSCEGYFCFTTEIKYIYSEKDYKLGFYTDVCFIRGCFENPIMSVVRICDDIEIIGNIHQNPELLEG